MEKAHPLQGVVEFVASVDAGSFSAAARKLGVSVAHVSRQVAELERRTGLQLLRRTSRRSAPTEAGSRYHARCRDLLDGLEEAREALQDEQDLLKGNLRISVGGHFAEDHLNPVLLRFVAAHPGIRLEVEVSSRNVDLVDEGFDLAVRAGPLQLSSLKTRRLTAFPVLTLAAPALLKALGTPKHSDELDPAHCLCLGGRPWTFHLGKENRRFTPQGRVVSNSGSTLIKAAVVGLGMVQLPGYYGPLEIEAGQLEPVLQDWASPEPFEFHIVYPSGVPSFPTTRFASDFEGLKPLLRF